MQFELTLEELHRICALIEDFGEQQQWPPDLTYQVHLVIDEVGTNVVEHGRTFEAQSMEVKIISDRRSVIIEITDDGKPFNPLQDAPSPDFSAALEDRQIGGLGLHLIRELMDEESYERAHGKNQLTLVKLREWKEETFKEK